MDRRQQLISELVMHLKRASLRISSYERVCSELGVTPAILRKALESTGNTFRKLVDEERKARLENVFNMVEVSRGATQPPSGKYLYSMFGFYDIEGFYRWHKRVYGEGYGVRVSKFMLEHQRKMQ